jgi:hypothetical protein
MTNRRLPAIALFAVIAFGLSGCAVVDTLGSAADEARMGSALDNLEDELTDIPGVTSVESSMPIRGDLTFDVSLNVKSDGLTMQNQRVAADAVTDVFTSSPFNEQPRLWLSISEGPDDQLVNRLQFDIAGFAKETVVGELDYLDAFAAAAGQNVTMGIYPAEPAIGLDYYARSIAIADPSLPVDWAALRAVPDVSGGDTMFSIGDVLSRGAVIPEELEALADEFAGPHERLYWDADEGYVGFDVYSEEQSDDFESLPAWRRIVELAALAQSSGAGLDTIGGSIAVGANAYFGDCDEPAIAGIAEKFAAALERAGIDGAKPGLCQEKALY